MNDDLLTEETLRRLLRPMLEPNANRLIDGPWLIAQLRAAERRVVREGEMRVLAADALEAGDDVARVAAYLRYISSEEVTAEDLEWARNVVERQDAATLASTQPATQDGPAEEAR